VSLARPLRAFLRTLGESLRDLLPIIVVIAFFQLLVLGQPIPQLFDLLFGTLLVVLGLTFFVYGLEMGLCFGTTVAEPALIAVADEASEVAAANGSIASDEAAREDYAFGLRMTVALSVGLAVLIGVYRIIRGWPLHYLIIGGYLLVVLMTVFAPREIIGIAYDSGGVTTSTITVPLVTALGVGLASSIRGRNPMIDGFGLIALASLTPMIFVMGYGMLVL